MISRGSEWHRWEPHVHAPGTLMNDQFKGHSAWNDYLGALEGAVPTIEAIGVTDYYVTETYECVVKYKQAGRLRSTLLIFPNVELRLDAGTKGGFVNMHLLVSPEDEDHITKLQRFLARLQFTVQDDRFDCRREELIRLGRTLDPTLTDERAALAHGARQFKVNFRELREVFKESEWAQANILVAVAGGTNDGTSGIKGSADQALRQQIERFADLIFASSPAQREFWLGEGALKTEDVREQYRGLKPCLHGSDAHAQGDVGKPFGDRFSWVKGKVEYDSLRHACIVPRSRAYVGAEPPAPATPSQVIAQIETKNALWMQTPAVPLNPGLVAIIGARGSGKTALADVIAAGCDSMPEEAWDRDEGVSPSFLARARRLLGDAKVSVTWAAGDRSIRSLNGSDGNDPATNARIRYLSQQFVEDLCSSTGMTDGLLREIERVVFEAHPEHDRDGVLDFEELLENRASRHRFARAREADAVATISERISVELEKDKLVAVVEADAEKRETLVDAYTGDRAKLVSAGSEERVSAAHSHRRCGEQGAAPATRFGQPKADLSGAPRRGEGSAAEQGARGLTPDAGASRVQRSVGQSVGGVLARLHGRRGWRSCQVHRMGRRADREAERHGTTSWRHGYAAHRQRRRSDFAPASSSGGRDGTAREASQRG